MTEGQFMAQPIHATGNSFLAGLFRYPQTLPSLPFYNKTIQKKLPYMPASTAVYGCSSNPRVKRIYEGNRQSPRYSDGNHHGEANS